MKWASLPDGEDWLLRPVLSGCCKAESLLDGTVDLALISLLNDALDVKAENHVIAQGIKP